MDEDVTFGLVNWDDPSDTEEAARVFVTQKLRLQTAEGFELYTEGYGVTDIDLADMVVYAPQFLWYAQAMEWKLCPPRRVKGLDREIWRNGARLLVELVDGGYNPVKKTYWTIPSSWGTGDRQCILLADFFAMVTELLRRGDQEVSRTFAIVGDLVLGMHWEERLRPTLESIGRVKTFVNA
jgi:hypothetical protein